MGLLYLPENPDYFDNTASFENTKRYIYLAGGDILAPIFEDSELTIKRANPMEADVSGRFDRCYLLDGLYRVVIRDHEDTVIYRAEDVYVTPNNTLGLLRGFQTVSELSNDATLLYGSSQRGFLAAPGSVVNVGSINQNYRVAEANATDHHITTEGGVKLYVVPRAGAYNVEAFGAVGDGVTDDGDAIAAAIAAAKHSWSRIVFGKGSYYVTATIDCRDTGSNGITLVGSSWKGTKIITDRDIAVISHSQFFTLSDISIEQTGSIGTGKAILCPTDKESHHCVIERVRLVGFKYGILKRVSIWDSYRDLAIYNCTCGIRLARHDDMENQSNPDAVAGWNIAGGWYHNQITFDNVLCQGGEVGIWASCMGATFNNVTCQQQDQDGSANTVLPVGEVGTGVWVQGGTEAGAGGGFGHNVVFLNYYTEVTRKSLKATDLREVHVKGWFAQGGTLVAPYETVLEADNADIYVEGVTGQDYWTNNVTLSGGAEVFGRVKGDGSVPSMATGTGYYPNNMRTQVFLPVFAYDNTGNGVSATIPVAAGVSGLYRVSVVGIYNGLTPIHCVYQVARWSTPGTYDLALISGVETGFSLSLDAQAQCVINQTGVNRLELRAYIERLSDQAGDQAITLTAE